MTMSTVAADTAFWTYAELQFAAEQVGDVSTTLSSVQIVSLFVSTVLPILVGLLTKASWNSGLKAMLLLFLNAVSGFATEWLANPDTFNWTAALLTTLASFMVSVAMHYGIWKPTKIADSAQATLVHD